ncbi:MAG: ATP-binding protein [Bacteroidaceae bacterium]
MKAKRVCSCGKNVRIVRPLLDVSREEILEYLKSKQQSFVTDSTNLVADVKRNKIRLEIIPQLREINPSVCDTLQKEIRKFSDAYNIYKDAVGKVLDEIEHNVYGDEILYAEKLNVCVSPEIVLFEWLSPKGFNEDQIENASRNGGKRQDLWKATIIFFISTNVVMWLCARILRQKATSLFCNPDVR